MHNIELFIYNSFWYYTYITESCSSLFTRLRNHCGCYKKVPELILDEYCEDLLFRKHYDSSSDITYYTFTEQDNLVLPEEYTICDYEFIEVSVKLSDTQTYTINMNRQASNFYCVGNLLNHAFFEWYLKKFYNFKSLEKNTYIVTIIDNNVEEHIISGDQGLVLDKETFKIYPDQ